MPWNSTALPWNAVAHPWKAKPDALDAPAYSFNHPWNDPRLTWKTAP